MNLQTRTAITAILLSIASSTLSAAPEPDPAPWPAPDPTALRQWQDMRFGMFIHWGPVSLTGKEIGWSRGRETPVDEYDSLYKRFNPQHFDADNWAQIAQDAGMKYMVITTKHHDGFCLWPSEVTDYDLGESPFKRDVLAELSTACRDRGIRFGTYYSTCDWRHPAFPLGSPGGKTKKPNPDLRAYDKYLRAQTEELVKNYGPLVTMWFDVPQVYDATYGVDMVKRLRAIQPDILINNRAYAERGRKTQFNRQDQVGDYSTPEQRIGGFDRERPWETCMTLCRQWAWKPNDKLKSLEECLQTLIRTAGGDGNLLLNVGPMPDGRIEARQAQRLREMGDWLKKYGQAIYGTRGGPFKPGKWGASTCREDRIFLFVMNWPRESSLALPALAARITQAEALTGGVVSIQQTDAYTIVSLPKAQHHAIATVIELVLDGDVLAISPLEVAVE